MYHLNRDYLELQISFVLTTIFQHFKILDNASRLFLCMCVSGSTRVSPWLAPCSETTATPPVIFLLPSPVSLHDLLETARRRLRGEDGEGTWQRRRKTLLRSTFTSCKPSLCVATYSIKDFASERAFSFHFAFTRKESESGKSISQRVRHNVHATRIGTFHINGEDVVEEAKR